MTGHRDLVVDDGRGLLYVTTDRGVVERIDLNTGARLAGYTLGSLLLGADMTPDGRALYVAEGQAAGGQGVVHKIDLTDGRVSSVRYTRVSLESGAYDIAIGANGKGLVTTQFAGSGWTPLRDLDTATDTLTARSGTHSQVRQNSQIHRSGDGSLFLLMESNISSGPIFTFDVATNSFPRSAELSTFLDGVRASMNRDGSLIAKAIGGVSIMDRGLKGIEKLSGVTGGFAFDPTKDVFYALDVSDPLNDWVVAFDTRTWDESYRFRVGENVTYAGAFDSGTMRVTADGRYLALATPSGVRVFDLVALSGGRAVTVAASSPAQGVDFGSFAERFPEVRIADAIVTEGNSGTRQVQLTVTLSEPSYRSVRVTYATTDGSAASTDSDYVHAAGAVTFAPGETSKTVTVTVRGDTKDELDERLVVNLMGAVGAVVADAQGVVTILNDDTGLRGSVGGTLWDDADGDGVRDAGEAPLVGWTTYVDANRNGRVDVGEPTAVTGGDGRYAITGLPAGEYVVAQVLPDGWQQTSNRGLTGVVGQTFLLPSGPDASPLYRPRDLVYDPLRRHLLVTTADGTVERLDLTDMRLLDPFKVGSSLLGADIAPDGGSLYVAESVRNVTQGFVRKVNLADGSVTNLAYDLAGLESGAYDIAITADGRALVTTLFAGSGWIPLRVLDLATGTFSNPTGLRSVRQNTDLYRSADRSRVLLLEGNISSGPVHVYDAATGGFPAGITTDTFVTYYPAAVNRDGSLNAIGFSGLAIYDANLRPVPAPVLSDRTTGLAFDPTRDVLYRAGSTEITVFETGSFTELFRFPIGETLSSKTPMAVSDDGRFLFLGTAAGVRVYRLAADARRVTLAAGQAVTDADFLNRSVTNNRRPAAADDAFSVAEDGALTGNLFANDSDPDGDPLSVIQVSGRAESVGTPITLPSGALLTVNADGTFAYDPNGRFRWLGPGETDTDTFTYSVSDGWGGTATARVKVTIEGVDDLPVTPVLRETVWEHESVTIYLPYDIDPDSESQIVSLDTAGTRGTIAFGDYHIEYTPGDAFDHLGPDETATETFRYTVEDDLGNASTGLVTVTILGEDDLAVVKDDVATTSEDKPVTGNVLANDSDIDTPLRVAALNGVAADIGRRVRLGTSSEPRGYLTLKADGSFVFDPAGNFEWLNAGFDGPEEVTFTYTLSDGETGTVTVAVEGVNDPPRVEPGDFSTGESESFTDRLFGMFADRHPEGDLVSVAAVNGDASAVGRAFRLPSGAIVTVEADGRFTYDPNGAFVRLRYGERADDVFTYTAADGYGGRAAVAVEVTVWGGGGEADLSAFYRGEWWVAESSGTPRFLSRRWAGWADVPWDALRHGDFDGDGRSDVLGLLDGQWWVGLSSGSSYQARLWTTWADVDWKDVTVGDLDGNGKDDLLARHGGRWWAALSFGYGFTAPLVWTAWADAAWRNVTLTDLDADGDADLLGYLRGQWWAALSTGGSFAAATLRAHWTDVAWEALGTFDADGDGRTDVYGLLGGEWWVGRSAGGVFATSLRAKWAAVPWRDAVAGDFDGDGRDDLAARHAGEWWVGLSAAGGSGGATTSWARWADTAWKDLRVADFDGDGRDDLAARYGGQWWVGASTGSAFATTLWATWADVAWKAVAAAETNVPAATGGGSSGSGITLSGSSSSSSFTVSLPAPVRPPSAPIAPVSTIDEEESLAHFWSKADEDEDLAAGLLTAR